MPGFGDGVTWDSRFITPGEFTNYSTHRTGSDLDVRGFTAIVDWQPGAPTFTSITAYRDMESAWSDDADLSPLTIISDILNTSQDQFSQEFNLRGRAGPLDWLVGAYFFEEEATFSGGPVVIPEVATVEFDPIFGAPNPLFGVPLSEFILVVNRARSTAVFSHLEYAYTERLSGSIGVRYMEEEKRVENSLGIGPVMSTGDSRTFDNLSPMIGVQYFINENLQVYGSVSEGFKSGGFNTLVVFPREDYLPFDPEQVTSYVPFAY